MLILLKPSLATDHSMPQLPIAPYYINTSGKENVIMLGRPDAFWIRDRWRELFHAIGCLHPIIEQSSWFWLMIGCKITMVVSSIVLSGSMHEYSSLCNFHLKSAIKVYAIYFDLPT